MMMLLNCGEQHHHLFPHHPSSRVPRLGGHVTLESRDAAWMYDPHVQHAVDSTTFKTATVNVSVGIETGPGVAPAQLMLRVTYFDPANKTLSQAHASCGPHQPQTSTSISPSTSTSPKHQPAPAPIPRLGLCRRALLNAIGESRVSPWLRRWDHSRAGCEPRLGESGPENPRSQNDVRTLTGPGAKTCAVPDVTLQAPPLWSPDSPRQHRAIVELLDAQGVQHPGRDQRREGEIGGEVTRDEGGRSRGREVMREGGHAGREVMRYGATVPRRHHAWQ